MTELREGPDTALQARLDGFSQAATLAAKYYTDDEVAAFHAQKNKAAERLRHGTTHTVVAIAGATGSGKSSIVNRFAGTELTKSSVRRPTTSATHAVVWGESDAGPLLDWLEVPHRYQVETEPGHWLNGLVLLDLPDHDSTAFEHRIEVDRLVELVDVLIWVTDPQKYADAALHLGYIQPLASHASILRFVLNQADRLDDGGAAVAADFGRLLADDGIVGAEPLAVSALTGAGFDEFTQLLVAAIDARNAALVRVEADLTEVAKGLVSAGTLANPRDALATELISGLSEASGAIEAADVASRHHKRQGLLEMGWPFTRWARRLRKKPLADLPGPGRTGAAAPRADLALRDYAEAVASNAAQPWPRAVRNAAFEQRDELLDDLRQSVGRETVKAGSKPAWWTLIAWLQRLFAGAAIVGFVWLIVVAILGGFFMFDTEPLLPPTPEAEWMPLPSALLIVGIVAGLVLGLVVRIPLGVGAARRGRRARKAIEQQVEEHANNRVIDNVQTVVNDRATIAQLIASPHT